MIEKQTISFNSAVTTTVFVLSFLLVGVPLWWKTTEVFRHPIPYEECQSLLDESVLHSIPIKLVLGDSEVPQGILWEELLHLPGDNPNAQPAFSFLWSMSSASQEEYNLIVKSHSIEELDDNLDHHNIASRNLNSERRDYGQLQIFILNQNYTKGPKYTIGKYRQGYILNNEGPINLAQDIYVLARKMVQVERLQKLSTPASSYGGNKKPDKERMRHLRSTKNFDITFSLIVSEPQALEVHWDIENAVDAYLKDVLKEIELISNVKVKSQVLYMTSLHIPTQNSIAGKELIVRSEDLPSLINPIETKLGSDISVHPNLNFVLYIPTRVQAPLRIHDSGSPLKTNAFMLPQWGGFMIYNIPIPENASLPHYVELDARAFMQVFLSQLRMLLGLTNIEELSEDSTQVLSNSVIHKWELDFLLRKNAQEQLAASITSLSSLSQLLKTIGNIVIREDVGEKIHFALSSTKDSLELLSRGHLLEGFLKSQSAFVASDEAFFDPSLLALLYFPEDQKYAIYIPLFLPVSIPVITSLRHLWKYWKDSKQKSKLE